MMADAYNYENRLGLVGTITEPVTVDELKLYCGIDTGFTADDALLTAAITAGREFVQTETGRQRQRQTEKKGERGRERERGGRENKRVSVSFLPLSLSVCVVVSVSLP